MKLSAVAALTMLSVPAVLAGCAPQPQPPRMLNPLADLIANPHAAVANAQPYPPPVTKTALAGATTRILFVQNLNPDCSVRDIPTVRVLTPPAHGTEAVKTIEDFGTTVAFPMVFGCSKNKARGAALDYVANADYTGPDTMTYEVIYSNGVDQTTTVKLTVK